jgi:hypothetical protein
MPYSLPDEQWLADFEFPLDFAHPVIQVRKRYRRFEVNDHESPDDEWK